MEDKLPKLYLEIARSNPNFPLNKEKRVSLIFLEIRQDSLLDKGDNHEARALSKGLGNEGAEDKFYLEIHKLKENIAKVQSLTIDITTLKSKAIQATLPDEQEENSHSLFQVITTATKEISLIKDVLNALKITIDEFERECPNSAEAKMRRNMHSILTRKFRQTLQSYQVAQTEYKNEVRKKTARQIHLAIPQATDEEVIDMVNADINAKTLMRVKFSKAIHEDASNALANLEQKYEDIRLLEKNVVEMHQMFVDISTLIGTQSELLDQIEFSVNSAKDYADKTQKELIEVRKSQKKAKRRTLCISVIISVIALIILLAILIGFLR